jgi:hypothetical protein
MLKWRHVSALIEPSSGHIQGDSLARGPKLLEKHIQACLDVKGDHFEHRL